MLAAVHNATDGQETPSSPLRRRWLEAILLFALLVAVLGPRLLALDRFMTADEQRWLARSANMYLAISQGDWAGTYQREHPGVITMWAGTAGLLSRFPSYSRVATDWVDETTYPDVVTANGHTVIELLTASRIFAVIGHTVVLLLCFPFARRLLGLWPAFVGLLFVAFDPFHMAHSRLLHLDGLLSSLLLLALLAFLSYLAEGHTLDLIVSGIAAGLSWLAKSPGLFLIPAVGLIAVVDFWRRLPNRKGLRPLASVGQFLWPLLVWGLVGLAMFVVCWPAMWVDPIGTLSNIITGAIGYAEAGHGTPVFFGGEIFESGELETAQAHFYPVSYLWRSTPVIVVGLIVAAVAWIRRWGPLAQPKVRFAVVGLTLFALVFATLMGLGSKKFDRYLLSAFPPLDLVAAVGWVSLGARLRLAPRPALKRHGASGLVAAAIVMQMVGTLWTAPYYLSYYNPLVGGGWTAQRVLMIGWGEGLDEAARYINQKPDSTQLRVASWYRHSFSCFFSGTTQRIPIMATLGEKRLQRILGSDYAVIYIHQWQRESPKDLLDYLAQQTPEHTVRINGLEYARIYKLNTGTAGP